MSQPYKSLQVDKLDIRIYSNESELGPAAAAFVVQQIHTAISEKGTANMILATGTSQFSFLEALKQKEIDWDKISVFHLDEYKGISDKHPASFRKYLKERILDQVKPAHVYLIPGDAVKLDEEIEKYADMLRDHPIDVACIGVGENGHIAFNDPPVADFNDPRLVKVVELDEACRNQQLGEGWFPTFDDVPKEAVTLTVPAILRSRAISCVVPHERKSEAIKNALYGPVSTACPASILRTHSNTILFLDSAAASGI